MELYTANNQWATRPADERFWTIEEAYQATLHYAGTAKEYMVPATGASLYAERDGNITLQVTPETRAQLTHYSFGQIAKRAGAPAGYLRGLSAETAVACLTEGLSKYQPDQSEESKQAKLLVHENGRVVARAVTSEGYSRVWNHQIFDKLRGLEAQGWQVPPARPSGNGGPARPATAADLVRGPQADAGGLSVKIGDPISPAGLYASDHDMFAFMVNEGRKLDDGSAGGLSRGFFVSNSEVGAAALKISWFLYRSVCGNHIVWGAEDVIDISVRHVGEAWGRFEATILPRVQDYADRAAKDDESRIRRAQRFQLGTDADSVLDAVFGLMPRGALPAGIGQKVIRAALTAGEQVEHIDGHPFTLWGFANAMTRAAQNTPYADDRVFFDSFAGRVLDLVLAG